MRLVARAGHGRLLRGIARLLFGKKSKKRVVWVFGNPNSGKSQFIRRLRSILGSDEVSWRGAYLPVKERNRSDLVTQVVTCEEFNFKHAFAEGTLEVTKLLFEGEGASVRKDLYAMFQKAYKDVIFCVASNKPMTTMIEMAET